MARTHIAQTNFTAGIFDPTLYERYEYAGYANGLKELDNLLIIPQGGVEGRPGTSYVVPAKNTTATRFIPFIVSNLIAYVLELGAGYIRFYADNGQITVASVPVEVTTPYSQLDLADLQYTENGNTMVFMHPDHAPHELVRNSGTEWLFRPVVFSPPPTYEAGFLPPMDAAIGSVLGTTVAFTAASDLFLPADVNRLITQEPSAGSGQAVITTVVSATAAFVDIVAQFSTTALLTGKWRVGYSPAATLSIDTTGPIGSTVHVIAHRIQDDSPELVTDGDFPNLTNWANLSGTVITTGAADTGSGDELLFDAAGTFLTSGVRTGHRAIKTSGGGGEDRILEVQGPGTLVTTKQGTTWANGDSYSIEKTGVAYVDVTGNAVLDGGRQGIAWIEGTIATTPGVSYRLTFDVFDAPLSVMVGSNTTLSDLLAEFSYGPGNDHEVFFTATGNNAFIGVRNNQDQVARIGHVSCKLYDVAAFRPDDRGRFIRVNNGLIELTTFTDATKMSGVVRKSLNDTLDSLPGAWNLESIQWSDSLGWPHVGTFQGGRLNFGTSDSFPSRIWGSRISNFYNFSQGTAADDSFQFDLSATRIDKLEWMAGERTLLAGTQKPEYVIQGELGHTITPTGVDVSSPTSYGSTNIQPIRTPSALFFVHRSRRKLYESIGLEDLSGTNREVQERSILAESLIANGITNVVYQQSPRPRLWVVTTDGKLLTLTYLREHVIAGWNRNTTQGTVLDACVIPHPAGDRDQLWLLVIRNGTVPSIEYMDDETGFYGQRMTDSSLIAAFDPPTTTVSNLDHLEGLTVTVLGDGLHQESKTVSGGEITLDTAVSHVEIGLSFRPKLTTLRPTIGPVPLAGLMIASTRINIALINTLNLLINGERLDFSSVNTPMDGPQPLFTGLKEVPSLGWDTEATITIEQDLPYPITVAALTRILEIEDVNAQPTGSQAG